MNIKYIKADPTKNMTLLVLSSVSRNIQPETAAELLRLDDDAEQVGFLEKPENPEAALRLQMMGGEFCGNASMSAAAYVAEQNGLPEGESAVIPLEVSGADDLIRCRVTAGNGFYTGEVSMPLPEEITEKVLETDSGKIKAVCVYMPGITHIIMPGGSLGKDEAEKTAPKLCRELSVEAVGIIQLDEKEYRITPLVYVDGVNSTTWERGCGSGTAAVGCCEAWKRGGSISLDISQPGGVIKVNASCEGGKITALSIKGKVKLQKPESIVVSYRIEN